MATLFQFSIVTPEKVTYEASVTEVVIPTAAGEITVLAHHTPIVSTLTPGRMIVRKEDGSEQLIALSGGLLEVRQSGELVVLADTAERAEDIDAERAEAGRKRAEEAMSRKEMDRDIEYAELDATLKKELARIKVAELVKVGRRAG